MIDWSNFQNNVNQFCIDQSNNIKNTLIKFGVKIDEQLLLDYLYINLIIFYYLNNTQRSNFFKNFKNKFFYNKNLKIEQLDVNDFTFSNKILSLGAYERHPDFIKELDNHWNLVKLKTNKKKNYYINNSLLRELIKILNPKNISSIFNILYDIQFLIINKDFLTNWTSFPSNILFTAHGIYENKSRLLIAICKKNRVNIVGFQCGLSLPMFEYYYQLHYETLISNTYLNWFNFDTNHYFSKSFGSPIKYTFNKLNQNIHIEKSTTIFLPQVPIRKYNIPHSGYWEKSKKDFNKNTSLLVSSIKNIDQKFDNVSLRCKELDSLYYKKFVQRHGIKMDIKFDNSILKGEINYDNKISKDNIFLYPSTAIMEYSNLPINLFCNFGDFNNNLFNSDFKIFERYDSDQFNLKINDYILKIVKDINPAEAINKLKFYIKD